MLPEDKQIAEEKLKSFSSKSDLSVSELITEIGLSFLGTPYVVASLENGLDEKLVINLRELDCTTFVENCLALARTVKLGKTDFESFVAELEKIRYRDGIRNQYPSRLHYFSEWIQNNHEKGIISENPNLNGEKSGKIINYMSTHPAQYPVLKEHPELIPSIAAQEKELTTAGFMFFPKENLPNLYKYLQHGDIIALTSSIEGVDINHVGIVLEKSDGFYLLHAPLSGKKVLVSDEQLSDFLKPASKNNGIMIARPVFQDEVIQ
jgi:cell wall-associated NlpC family hydrolase